MSCNCSNNPCSCANTNCACPPDYSIDPATIACPGGSTCEDTITTTCTFTTQYLSCSQIPIGSSLDVALLALDAKICQCGSCSGQTQITTALSVLSNFYVDSLNTQPGDGTVINPFQSIDLAYTKVIGTGSVLAPQFPFTTVHVAAGHGYSTAQNIYIPTITWDFLEQVTVVFTGSGTYFIDSSIINGGLGDFSITGYLNFKTSTGGFLRNQGSYYTAEKHITAEFQSAIGSMNGTSFPFIDHNLTNSSNLGAPIRTWITLKPNGIISSEVQNTIRFTGSSLNINLNYGTLAYGYNLANGQSTGVSAGNAIYYNNVDSSSTTYFSDFTLINGYIATSGNNDMISINGIFRNVLIENIKTFSNSISLPPNTFLNIGNTTLSVLGSNIFRFLLKDVYLSPEAFNLAAFYVITYTGVQQSYPYLQMQNCILYSPLVPNPNLKIGLLATGLLPVTCYDIISGQMQIYNMQTTAGIPGSLFNSSGVVHIA